MSLLSASNLAMSYGVQDVFEDISFAIPHEAKVALIGPNGSGKTTLLRLIAGQEVPTKGAIHRARRTRVAYLPQQVVRFFDDEETLWGTMLDVFAHLLERSAELERLEAAMADPSTRDEAMQEYGRTLEAFERDGGYAYEHRIEQVLTGLGFAQEDFQRSMGQLSGGQKTRALLARLLLEDPDLLLLDEPTNHLDLAGVEWLENYLASWQGALMVVAHDRAFLDATVDRVWELAWGRLDQYRGNYSDYVDQKAERVARQQFLYEQQQETIARTEEFIRRNIAGQRSKEAKGRRKRLERLERIERPHEYHPISFSLGEASRSGDLVFGLYDLTVGYDPDQPLLKIDELELRRGQRVALLGPNGCGKTSLLRTILGQVPPLGGQVRIGASVELGYLAQGYTNLDPERTVLDTVVDAGRLRISEARDLLGRYRFSGDLVFKRVGDLSGGEQARVALAALVLQGANVLVLDEPTNYLDIPTQEVLEEMLDAFNGTVLMVSHDRYLIRRLAAGGPADSIWAVVEGPAAGGPAGHRELRAFRGYEAYSEWRHEEHERARDWGTGAGGPARHSHSRLGEQPRRAAASLARREAEWRARRQSELEGRIHDLEARQADLERQLAAASESQDVARVRELGAEYSDIEQELNDSLAEWAELG
jgi:ATP-binding cassette subfamily F protein 3